MSKKIMKRSLALGALMAFVITGNVWAGVTVESSLGVTPENIENINGNYVLSGTEDSSIFGGYTTSGYAITHNGGSLTIKDCTLSNIEKNISGSNASVLYSDSGGKIDICNLVVQNNKNIGSKSYGVIRVAGKNTITNISGSDFVSNIASGSNGSKQGGAIYHSGGVLTISESSFINNGVEYKTNGQQQYIVGKGGAIAVNGNTSSGNNDTVYLNLEGKSEIGRKFEDRIVYGNLFYGNTAQSWGGAINSEGGAVITLSGINEFTNNIVKQAGRDLTEGGGGAIGLECPVDDASDDEILNVVGTAKFNSNSAINGGAIFSSMISKVNFGYVESNNSFYDTKVEFVSNNATGSSGGGAIYNIGSININVDNSISGNVDGEFDVEFNANEATKGNGGAIFNDGRLYYYKINGTKEVSPVINFENGRVKFYSNVAAQNGGAIYNTSNAVVNFNGTNIKFDGNNAKNGGAVFNVGSSAYVSPRYVYYTPEVNFNSGIIKFENNKASENGGAVFNDGYVDNRGYGYGYLNFNGADVEFNGNEAKNGGAIYNGSNGIVDFIDGNVEFKDNVASSNGGAICNYSLMNFGSDAGNNIAVKFSGNTVNGDPNDIFNGGVINIYDKATVTLMSGMGGAGYTNVNGGVLELGGDTEIGGLGGSGTVRFLNAIKLKVAESFEQDIKSGDEIIAYKIDGLKFTATGEVNDAIDGDAGKLIDGESIAYAEGFAKEMTIEAGDVSGVVTAKLGATDDGKYLTVLSQEEAPNPANEAISDAAIGMKLHWRAHVNDMNKRMGELRDANGEHGVWTRMVRGESEYKNVKAQYNQYQLGYDEKLSVDKRWTVGAAVTFSEGDSSYGYGSTEDKSTAFAIYGSKLNNDGTFVDLIARYAHLESDVDDQAGKGSYSANGMSVSAEFGKRIQQGNGLWIEPQAELTYGTIDSAEYKLGTKTVEVGDMDSLIGRIGFRIGKDIEKGNVYARASYLYDFEGETENVFRNDTARRSFNEDLGGGWWEVGVGANINLSKATYVYADIEKTFGGEVDTNWQWNLGVRYSF